MVRFKPSMAWSIFPLGFAGVFLDRHAGIIQRQPDGVDGLDDAIVQVHADALALFEHCQAAGLLGEAGVFDGDTSPGADGSSAG